MYVHAQVEPLNAEVDEDLRKWADKTPGRAQAKGAGQKPGTAASGKSKDGKKGKKGKKK